MNSTVAESALARGHSRQDDFNQLIEGLWLELAAHGVVLYVDRAPSAQNPADAPTRPREKAAAIAALKAAGFAEEDWEWPRHWLPRRSRRGPRGEGPGGTRTGDGL